MSDITFKHHDPNVMLELWHVTKRFGGLTAVGDVSFKIKKGEIYELIGHNGAGKTTIFNLITGVYALTEGRVIFDGTVVGQGDAIIKDDMRETDVKPFRKQPYDIMSRGMARTFQNIRLFKSETVYNNVLTACHAEADYNIFQSLWRLKVGPKWLTKYYYQEKALREKTEELLKIMGIWEQRDMIAVNLPYGQQRKLEIARALATDPKLLLLDEPAAGMNPEETLALMDLIREIRDRFDLTVLIIEHHMDLVMNVSDRIFVLIARADPDKDTGEVDYLSPLAQEQANPSWGVTIRPSDMMASALQAQNDPQMRKEFLTRSLNVFVSSFKACFDVADFRRSDAHYHWTQQELARLVTAWYGGADLSKLNDLTAAYNVGEIPASKAASEGWTPSEDVLVIVPHAWFPRTAAAEKSDVDNIPLFGWKDDGWLDMPNESSMDPTEPVKQFKKWQADGFRIRKVGHDRKFARPYYTAMKKAGFTVVDQPQLYLAKSEGFRYIEHKMKIGCLYYCGAEPFEYCVGNIRACEKVDDAVQYEKINDTSRIDVFDAAVFGTIRMLIDTEKRANASRWFESGKPNT